MNFMSTAYQIVVCGSIVPDPLQTLEPVGSPTGPALKNEMMLPAVLDPWAGHNCRAGNVQFEVWSSAFTRFRGRLKAGLRTN